MKRIDTYIFWQLFTVTLFVTATLTCVVWLTQSLRFIEMIVNRGLSAQLFVYFTILLLPTFLTIILPIALFAATLFVYNRLLSDSELVVMRAGGCSQFRLARPALVLTLLTTVCCYALTVYLMPSAYREFKGLQNTLRNSFPTVLLQEGVFNSVVPGVTVYVRSRSSDGELSGIIVHDARNASRPVTMMAEKGRIVTGANGPRVVMAIGNRQQVDSKDGRLSLLNFDRYSFDIGTLSDDKGLHWREPRERYLHELFNPEPRDEWKATKLYMEGHHRLAQPLLPIAFTLISLAILLAGDFNRRGQALRIIAAVSFVVLLETGQISAKNLGEKFPELAVALYLIPLVPAAIAGLFMAGWRPVQRTAALAAPD